jgi:hypothetical protein
MVMAAAVLASGFDVPRAQGPFNYYPYGTWLRGYSEGGFLLEGTTWQGLLFTTRMIVRRPTDPGSSTALCSASGTT